MTEKLSVKVNRYFFTRLGPVILAIIMLFAAAIYKMNTVKAEDKAGAGAVSETVASELAKNGTARVIVKLQAPKSMNIDPKDFDNREYIDEYQAGVVSRPGLEKLVSDPDVVAVDIDRPVSILSDDSLSQTVSQLKASGLTVDGTGKKICVIDTGIDYRHPDIKNFQLGYDFVNDDADPMDDQGHGTEVAGVMAALAPGSGLYVAKVIDADGVGYDSTVLAGLQWCVAQGADVINFSIGSGSYDGFCDKNLVAQAVNEAVNQGIFVAAATGNDGSTSFKSPSCASGAARVSSTDSRGQIAGFSNVSRLVDVLAPGVDLEVPLLGGGYGRRSGTSLSAPQVAAAAALVLEKQVLTPAQLTYRFRITGKSVSYIDKKTLQPIDIAELNILDALNLEITMIPYNYEAETSGGAAGGIFTPLAAGCGTGAACANARACCADGYLDPELAPCYTTNPGGRGVTCFDCDYGTPACVKCCAASGSSADVCTSTLYTSSYTFFSGACCGDDGASDHFNGDATNGCCCNGAKIATGNDALCSTYSNYWCLDGTYCTTGSGVAKDPSLTAGGTTYAFDGDDIVCGCDSSGAKCDTTDADTTANGICASTTCATSMVALSGSTYVTTCAAGYACDSDVTPTATTPRYVRNGYCATTSCCSSVINSGELTTPNWTDGDESCSCVNGGQVCDATPATGPSAEGVCASSGCRASNVVLSSGSYYSCGASYVALGCDSNTANGAYSAESVCISSSTCTTSQVCNHDSTYYDTCSSCSSASTNVDACDTSVSDGSYTPIGYCTTGGTCSTGSVYNNSGTLTDGCTNGTGEQCEADATGSENGAWSSYADGACVSGSTCDTGDVCVASGTYYGSMGSCSDSDACDSDVDSSGYSRDGYVCNSQSLNCVVDGSRGSGQSCCQDANCGGGLVCNVGTHTCGSASNYTPKSQNWRWYDDEWDCDSNASTHDAGQTCAGGGSSALANENTVPTAVGQMNAIKLRITLNETGGAEGTDTKIRLQYAAKVGEICGDGESFSNVAEPAATDTPWRYYNGTAGTNDSDNTVLGANRLSDSGSNKATHNESGTSATTFDHTASTAFEWEFTIQNYNATANTAYCFQAYDNTHSAAVPLNSGETLPELTTNSAYDLSISGPASANMPGYTLGSGGTDSNQFTDKDISVWDRRGTGAGWTLSATADDLDSGSHTITKSNISWTTDTIKSEYAENTTCSSGTGICPGSGSFSGTVTVMDADADTSGPSAPGWGGYIIDAWTILLSNLDTQYAGTYSSTITFTVL